MDDTQRDHLKAYGVAYWVLEQDVEMSWLLNYRGGSFMCGHHELIENECVIRGVSYQVIADVQAAAILQEIASPEVNILVRITHASLADAARKKIHAKLTKTNTSSCFATVGTLSL